MDKIDKAIKDTIDAYRRLINDPVEEVKHWEGYGTRNHCRICKLYSDCSKCILGDLFPYRLEGCMTEGAIIFDDVLNDIYNSVALIDYYNTDWNDYRVLDIIEEHRSKLIETAINRHNELVVHFNSKGYNFLEIYTN